MSALSADSLRDLARASSVSLGLAGVSLGLLGGTAGGAASTAGVLLGASLGDLLSSESALDGTAYLETQALRCQLTQHTAHTLTRHSTAHTEREDKDTHSARLTFLTIFLDFL